MLTLVLWLLFGALIGWLASVAMNRDSAQGAVGNIIVGIVGAAIGGYLFNRQVAPDVLNVGSLLTALVGAIVLLAIVNLAQRGRVR
jgi:uncharacterized membrane protein YeaQ/YmgE (transglycosylase-associated protein family)